MNSLSSSLQRRTPSWEAMQRQVPYSQCISWSSRCYGWFTFYGKIIIVQKRGWAVRVTLCYSGVVLKLRRNHALIRPSWDVNIDNRITNQQPYWNKKKRIWKYQRSQQMSHRYHWQKRTRRMMHWHKQGNNWKRCNKNWMPIKERFLNFDNATRTILTMYLLLLPLL